MPFGPYVIAGAPEWDQWAIHLSAYLQPGDLVTLDGPMGAGKTTFVRALVAALGGDPDLVTSPSYTLLHEYDCRMPFIHVDAWRLSSGDDLLAIGFDDQRQSGVACVEWPERVSDIIDPTVTWQLCLNHVDQGRRSLTVEPPSAFNDFPIPAVGEA